MRKHKAENWMQHNKQQQAESQSISASRARPRNIAYLTTTRILLHYWYVAKRALHHSPCKGITNAYAPQPLLSHQTTHIQSPIHPNFVINIPRGSAAWQHFSLWYTDTVEVAVRPITLPGDFQPLHHKQNNWGPAGRQKSPCNPHAHVCSESWSQRFRAQSQQAPHQLSERKQNRAGSLYRKINAVPKIA